MVDNIEAALRTTLSRDHQSVASTDQRRRPSVGAAHLPD